MTTLMKVELYGQRAKTDLDRRNKWIRQSRRRGFTLRQIADAANMTPQGISKIVRKTLDN